MIFSFIIAIIANALYVVFYPDSNALDRLIMFFVTYCACMVTDIYYYTKYVKEVNAKLANFIMNSLIEIHKEDEDE